MSEAVGQPSSSADSKGHHENHGLKLWPFFLALLALTAAEVGLYEAWRESAETLPDGTKEYFIPKFALIWLILVFTLPKAYIVFVYFMHIRFEKAIVVVMAVIPLFMVFICVLPTLTDGSALKDQQTNRVTTMKQDELRGHGDHDKDHTNKKHEKANKDANENTGN